MRGFPINQIFGGAKDYIHVYGETLEKTKESPLNENVRAGNVEPILTNENKLINFL